MSDEKQPDKNRSAEQQPTGRRSERRDFLSGRLARKELERRGEQLADELTAESTVAPTAGDTVRLSTRAMNCEFSIVLNASGDRKQVLTASDGLELVHGVETQLTVYRDTSELLELNRNAAEEPVAVDPDLFALLTEALKIAEQTGGAFNPVARALNALWRTCRKAGRLPEETELNAALAGSRLADVSCDADHCKIAFAHPELGFDLGGMGKGYALDRVGAFLEQEDVESFLIHGGHSSMLARGTHQGAGWPIGIRNPLFPQKRLATLVLENCGFSASGSGVQFFRHQGKRYGHIIDPRTGWPVDHMLSVAVCAPTAAQADALSTAFSVLSQAETEAYCEKHPEVAAILMPPPKAGARLHPVTLNLDPSRIFWEG